MTKEKKYIDYCSNCEEEINQIDLGDGEFGCPLCKKSGSIEVTIIDDYPEELDMKQSEDYDFKIFDGSNSYKEDYEEAIEYSKKTGGEVYTMVDGDDGETYYLKGYHFVNRFAYCVLKKEKKDE